MLSFCLRPKNARPGQWLVLACLVAALPSLAAAQEPVAAAPVFDPAGLTDGVWVGSSPAGENVFRLTLSAGRLTGDSFLVRDGKAISEAPVIEVTIEAPEAPPDATGAAIAGAATAGDLARIEIRLLPGWIYRGRLAASGTVVDGDLELGGGRKVPLRLERRSAATVPALQALPPAPPGEPAWTYHRPAESGDGWKTADAAAVGLDVAQLEELVADVAAGDAGLLHSLLLVKNGRLVLEEYFHGFGRDDLHPVYSCTKSVASLLVGLAIEDGDLAGVDTPWLELFPEIAETAAPGWKDVRLRHLLTMTAGVTWGGGSPPAGLELVRAAARRPLTTPAGGKFQYSDLDADLLAPVLYRATGVQADAYAARRLFAPLGIARWDWEAGKVDGYPRLYSNLALRPRDLAKLGALVLHGGRWQGRQVVPEAWVRESTRQQVETDGGGEGYGYLWWREPAPPSLPAGVISARGVGGQLVYVVPDLDLVVAVSGGNLYNRKDFLIGKVLLSHLLPAVAPPAGAEEEAPAEPAVGGG